MCFAGRKQHRPFDLTYIILLMIEVANRLAYENIGRAKLAAAGIERLQSWTSFPWPGQFLSARLFQRTGWLTGPFHNEVRLKSA